MQTFNEIVELHESRLAYLVRRYSTETERQVALRAERLAWCDIRRMLDDRGYIEVPRDCLTPEQTVEYTIPDFPLIGVMQYRGVEVPLYDDDCGQQIFARYDGQDLPGGPFNLDYCQEFADDLDYLLDEKFIAKLLAETGE